MRKHTKEFKEKIKLMGRQLDSKITFGETELGKEQLNSVTPVLQSALLKSVMKELDIDSNVEIPVGTIINYKFGILLDSGDYEYLDYGNYQVYSIEKQEDNNAYNIVAYDKMLNSMKNYEMLEIEYPISIRDYLKAICDKLNINFANENDEFANYDKIIPNEMYLDENGNSLGYTFRDVLDELSQVTASNIIINENDELEIKYITDTEDLTAKNINLYNYKDTYRVDEGYSVDENGWITISYDNSEGKETIKKYYISNRIKNLKQYYNYYIIWEIKDISGEGSITIHRNNNESQFSYWNGSNGDFFDFIYPGTVADFICTAVHDDYSIDKGLITECSFSPGASGSITFRISILEKRPSEFKYQPYGFPIDTIDEEYLKDINVKFGEKYGPINSIVLSRAAESDNVYLQDEQSVADNGLCELKIKDNQIMNFNDRSDYLQDILEKLNGLEFYINDFSSTGICYYEVADRYNVKVDENTYSCIMFNDEIDITQGLEEKIHTDLPEQAETDYTKADKTDRRINQTYIIVDKQNQKIDSVVTNVSQYDEKISAVEQTVDSITQKVENLVDLTREVSGRHSIILENCIKGNIINFSLHGTVELLYPAEDLYPADDLYPLDTYLIVKYEDETINKIKLPFTYLYVVGDTYDEFKIEQIDFEKSRAYIIRRIGTNTDGTHYIKTKETIEELGNFTIPLKDGNNTLTFESFNNVIVTAKFAIQNEYTDQFATKTELKTSIEQTEDHISLKVSKDQVISSINQSAEEIQINANRISLKGKAIDLTSDSITLNSTNLTIDEEGNLTCNNATIRGVFENLDLSSGKTAIRISETIINFYDWKGSESKVGQLCSTYYKSNDKRGISLSCEPNNNLSIGYKNNSSDTQIQNFIHCETGSSDPPWVKNTSSGTIFGRIKVKNGFITDWNEGTVSGTIAIVGNGMSLYIDVDHGLITNWHN